MRVGLLRGKTGIDPVGRNSKRHGGVYAGGEDRERSEEGGDQDVSNFCFSERHAGPILQTSEAG